VSQLKDFDALYSYLKSRIESKELTARSLGKEVWVGLVSGFSTFRTQFHLFMVTPGKGPWEDSYYLSDRDRALRAKDFRALVEGLIDDVKNAPLTADFTASAESLIRNAMSPYVPRSGLVDNFPRERDGETSVREKFEELRRLVEKLGAT
jgi:hypothetical protein